jgi:two-component system response regulator HupR/HoxA
MTEPTQRPAVLLLEDESQLTAALCASLCDEYDIETATSAEEALLLLGSRRFDLLLCDQMLPGKRQGLDFLAEALRHQPHARRVLVTGYLNPELLARGSAMVQLSACLVKPVDIDLLRKTLRDALAKPAPGQS